MNALQELEMQDIDSLIVWDPQDGDQAPEERFKVETLEEANWCLRKLAAIKTKTDEINALALAEIERIKVWQEGEIQNIISFRPPIRRSVLVKHNLVGWGNIRVAILDSGAPPDIQVVEEIDFTGTGIVDRLGHGTFVTRIIKHYAQASQILVAKIGNEKPRETALIRALEWAVDKGAHIINISSGFGPKGCKGNCELAKLINAITKQTSCIVVVAAGNAGPEPNTIVCPGCAMNAITVGALDALGNLAAYSSRGAIGLKKPNILAPGDITIDDKYNYGTSFAAPIISGILAASLNKFNNSLEAIKALYDTAESLGLAPHEQGFGKLNLDKYLEVMSNVGADRASQGQEQNWRT